MKTTYDVLQRMEDAGILEDAVQKGVAPVTAAFHKLTYEVFKRYYSESGKKTQAVMDTSIEVDLSERQVWKIIKEMES